VLSHAMVYTKFTSSFAPTVGNIKLSVVPHTD
jgi:hypothetical protein